MFINIGEIHKFIGHRLIPLDPWILIINLIRRYSSGAHSGGEESKLGRQEETTDELQEANPGKLNIIGIEMHCI